MTLFEKQIIDCFLGKFMLSKTSWNKQISILTQKIYPEFNAAPPDKKASFLEAAKKLEKRGILKLLWKKQGKDESLKSLICVDKEKLFKLSSNTFPKTKFKKIKVAEQSLDMFDESHDYKKLLRFIVDNLTLKEIERGVDEKVIIDFAKLLKILYDNSHAEHNSLFLNSPYTILNGITPRALSIKLYNDTGRLTAVKRMVSRVLVRAKKQGLSTPDFSFIPSSFPETLISGRISIHFEKNKMPMINVTGGVIGLPLETIKNIKSITIMKGVKKIAHPSVLTIENKETFFALAACKNYSCLLYTGGYPNRAVNTLVHILVNDGFDFFHAGDVDPDGILILQDLKKIVNKITPVCMDVDTFNKYEKHGKKLKKSALHNIRLISDDVRAIKGISDLIRLIESTERGIEQEVIDYFHSLSKLM
ncbi:MAG: DUF2220 domain-containing protein [Spirochaetaceae bacterium]|jgi:muconolactone delta-isomerase|nr:DUF2220 domain-containing protein [Spirochaetaceae bacterium]